MSILLAPLKKPSRLSKKLQEIQNLNNEKPAKLWTPHEYQSKAVKFLLDRQSAALFLDPGLGKTSITLSALMHLKEKGELGKVLIVAPLRVCHLVWPLEIRGWKNFKPLKYVVLHGKKKEELLKSDADIYIINPEGLSWLFGVTRGEKSNPLVRANALGFSVLVIDELSKFKAVDTNRFKLLKAVAQTFKIRWGLTGSPASNGLIDLFGQCYVLDKGEALGRYITYYRNEYFTPLYFGWKLKQGADERIYKALTPLALRMSATDYLKMPELIENNIMVDLPKEAMCYYKDLEKDLITNINNETIVAFNAAAASSKCRQVANGAVYSSQLPGYPLTKTTLKKSWLDVHNEKLDALCDLIDELQKSPLLVSYEFEHDLVRIKERLGKDTPYIGGGVTAQTASEIAYKWNRGEIPVLLGHPQSMGHGLNLQEVGNHVCFYSMTWNYELYDQFIRRVLRQGNKSKKVFVHHILADNTIDLAILDALKSKEKTQKSLFDALKRYASVK